MKKKKKLCLIKKPDGGGIHNVEIGRDASYDVLVDKACSILLANNPTLPLEDCLMVDAGHTTIKHKVPSPFTIQGYLKFLGKEKIETEQSVSLCCRES